jgi:DNA-binding transcriptional LysR family regulator
VVARLLLEDAIRVLGSMVDINPYRLKISQLRALVAIADTGTFSDAALALDLSQSAVSHAIATLEEELGVVLFNRGRQGAVLTPLGEDVTAEARRVMASLETIGNLAQQARGLHQGRVRIAGFRSVATHILPEVIQQFRSHYPGIQVKIEEFHHFRQVEQEVRQGRADIGFTYLPTTDEFEVWELLRDRYVLLLPPNAQPPTGPYDWDTLSRQSFILAPQGDGCRDTLGHYFAAAGYAIEPAYEVREDSTILSMVQQGLGVTIMARLAAEPIPPTLTVAELPVPMERVIGVIQLADALQPPPVFAFMEALKQVWQGAGEVMQPVG